MSDSDLTQSAKSASTASFVSAIVFNSVLFAAEIAIFTFLRPTFPSIYEPRTYVPHNPTARSTSIGRSLFAWPRAIWNADYRTVIATNGLDTYFFLRFLRMMVTIFLPIWLVSWAVLLPVTAVKSLVPGHSGLDKFTFGNVEKTEQSRYAAHIVLVYLFTGWIYYQIYIEMSHFIFIRQKYLSSPGHASSLQARTLLITGIPRKYLSENALMRLFGSLPGGVQKVWINRNLNELPDLYDEQLAACNKLESAETQLIRSAIKAQTASTNPPPSPAKDKDAEKGKSKSGRIAALVPPGSRPTHRLGFFGLWGTKVDSIEWAREEITRCGDVLKHARATLRSDDGEEEEEEEGKVEKGKVAAAEGTQDAGKMEKGKVAAAEGTQDAGKMEKGKAALAEDAGEKYPVLNSAFITFEKQVSAHIAKQVLAHHDPYRMTGRYTDVAPQDVIWSNLGLNPYEMKIRMLISYAITAALIIFWAIPVAFIGIISNIKGLCTTYKWLAWLCKLPSPVIGILQGILPPVLLVLLMMILPIVLRLLSKFEGVPRKTGLELSLMNRYFTFQVIHSFLIVTLASGIIAALPGLVKNPSDVANLLAANLPSASTFFLTYVILQGLAGTAAGFLQAVPLVLYYIMLFILGSTPRSLYDIKYTLRSVEWGTLWPGTTLLTVVAFAYMIISPIINGFACATFFAFYMLYKYLFLFQFGQPRSADTGGLFFPKAIQQTFVGLYVQQVCLCALFFLARNEKNKPSAIPMGALMVVLIVLTIFFQLLINDSYGPLIHALPLTLADTTYPVRVDEDDVVMNDDREDDPEFKEQELYGFAQPAASRPQRVVWIPRDGHGFAEEELSANAESGVLGSTQNATIDETGKVDVQGPPPDEPEQP